MRKLKTTLLGAFLFALLLAPLFVGCQPSVGFKPSVGPVAYDTEIIITIYGESPKTLYAQFPEDYDVYVGEHTLEVFTDAACTQKNSDWVVFRQGPILKITNETLGVQINAYPMPEDEEVEAFISNGGTVVTNLVIDGVTYAAIS